MDINARNELSKSIIGAAIEVHRVLGPGVLEHAYRRALVYELKQLGYKVETEVPIPFIYKGVNLDHTFRADVVVEDEIILELKATENDNPLFGRQLLSYLKLSNKRLGLLINFNRGFLKDGIKRVINS